MRTIYAKINLAIPLGCVGEHEAAKIVFDVSGWKDLYGDGTYTLLNQRKSDDAAYPVVITSTDTEVRWVVSNSDTQYAGTGKCQLVYTVDGVVAKSLIFSTLVLGSLDGTGDVPEPWEAWVQQVIDAKDDAEDAAEEAESARDTALTYKTAAESAASDAEDFKDEAAGIMGLATFLLDTSSGELTVTYPTPYSGATFSINSNGYLEVTTA